jgi:hypothetical protein
MSGFDKWQQGLLNSSGNPAWDVYDCDIQAAVNEYNRHLSSTPGYSALDWQLIKAMLWTETGAANDEWKVKPMQIGVSGDPGMTSLLSDDEGGELIIPPGLLGRMSSGTIRTNPAHNIRAGIGYLLMRMASFDHKSMREPGARIEEVKVQSGDSFDRIARRNGSTVEVLRELNPGVNVLQKDQVIKFQKASVRKVITRWRPITTNTVAVRYNGGGDENYARKLDFALGLVRNGRGAACTQ